MLLSLNDEQLDLHSIPIPRVLSDYLVLYKLPQLLNRLLGGKAEPDSFLLSMLVRAYLALKAHHKHNKPPNTMLATTTVILPTIHSMNSS